MQLKTENSFIRFLKDEKFIEWKLFPTDELNRYWEEYLQYHPGEREDILLAEQHFQNIDISSVKLSKEKKQEAIHRLEQSLGAYNRKRRIYRFAYIGAACVVALVMSVLYLQKEINQSSGEELVAFSDYIVGSELESEDILFITGDKTATFQSNVDIHLDRNNKALIKSDKDAEEISIEQHTMNQLIVPYGKRSKVVLSDGTQVWLNSGSTLEFPSTFSGEKREVFLSGEMYIEVAPEKNKSFYVHTSGYNVKVYGTKFNVSSYSGASSSVVLVEGSVSLQSTDRQELFLSPNEQAVYSETSGTFDTRKVDVHSFISWKEGYLSFEDTPVIEALKQIERYYNLSFNYGDGISLHGLTCTGKIILSDNLDNVMTALTLISDTKYQKEDKLIYIYKE
ncbi:FecR domain-containing protein [Proteiniphilum sp.]|uniref:FecR family protein n=1 Tax=Proteiniphilum sp. TaxID=1926877 RepID=UPI00331EB36D